MMGGDLLHFPGLAFVCGELLEQVCIKFDVLCVGIVVLYSNVMVDCIVASDITFLTRYVTLFLLLYSKCFFLIIDN